MKKLTLALYTAMSLSTSTVTVTADNVVNQNSVNDELCQLNLDSLKANDTYDYTQADSDESEVISKLRNIIKKDKSFTEELQQLLLTTKATEWQGKTIDDFVTFFAEWEISNVTPSNVQQYITPIFDLYNDQLGKTFFTQNKVIIKWLYEFMKARGNYMDSKLSTETLQSWFSDPVVNISQYKIPKGGFSSFNEFFTRQIKRDLRPVDSDEQAIVTPADGYVWRVSNNVEESDRYSLKGDLLGVRELLDNDPLYKHFIHGDAIIVYLQATDYHHFWSPVSGIIVREKQVGGLYIADGTPTNVANHRRAYYIIEVPNLGYVGMVVIGMFDISSINLKKHKGQYALKGEDIGNFAYGGSEIIMFFEPNHADFSNVSPSPSSTMKVGQKIGTITETIE